MSFSLTLAKDCGNLTTPLNGSVSGFKTTYPNELEFKCDFGFELRGSATRKCKADGNWSGAEVKCQGIVKIHHELRHDEMLGKKIDMLCEDCKLKVPAVTFVAYFASLSHLLEKLPCH